MIVSLIPTVVLSLSTGAQSFSTAEIQAGEFQALEVLTSGAGRLGSVAPRGPVAAGLQSLHKDERYGFQVKPPRGWRSIALKTEEGWLRAKFQSDKSYFYTDPALGYTFEHTPEVLCIAFVHEKMVKKREVEERDDGVTEITILNPYKDYEDFLDRTYAGGGWFVEEKEEGEHKGTPVTKYEIRVEKGARTGPKRMVTWVFHTDGIDFALQVEVLETEFRKLKSTVDGVIKSFKEIKRNGEPLNEATVSDGIRITRRERNSGTPKERRSKRMESQKVEQDKAIANLPEDWDHEFYGDILVLNHDQGDWAKRLGKHAEKLLEWFEDELYYFGEGEFARGPIIRVCKDAEEETAFARGVVSGTAGALYERGPGEEIVTHKDTAGWIGSEVSWVNQNLMVNWMSERDEDLYSAMPTWLSGGLTDFVAGARLDGRKLDFRVNDYVRDNARLAAAQDRATPARELMRFTREEFQSEGGAADRRTYWNRRAEAGMFVRFLLSKESSRCKQAKGLLEDYVRILAEVVEEVEKESGDESYEAPKTEAEEEEMAKARRSRWRAREKDIVNKTFERVFEGWGEKDWEKLHDAYFDFIGG